MQPEICMFFTINTNFRTIIKRWKAQVVTVYRCSVANYFESKVNPCNPDQKLSKILCFKTYY